jgi:hypothetical protein
MTESYGYLYDKLCVLNTVYMNSLCKIKSSPQTSVIKTKLLPHQLNLVNGMHTHRDKMTRGFLYGHHAINGKIGILGDPAGSGKTLSVLSYIASQITTSPRITCELSNNSSRYFFSHELKNITDLSTANLIIVPHNLYNQWKNQIDTHTTMSYVAIETKRQLKGNSIVQPIINSNFVLTTNRCYKMVQEYAKDNNIKWDNIFIDEASSIYLNSSDPKLEFQFLWLITNNWIPLLFKHPTISKTNIYHLRDRVLLHSDLEEWLCDNPTLHYESTLASSGFLKEYVSYYHEHRGLMVLRTLNEVLNSSMNMIDPINRTITCKPNLTLNALISYYLSRNIEPNINNESIPKLFQALEIKCTNMDNYISYQPEAKHALIRRKCEESECVICLDRCQYPTIVNCCYNTYCGSCLLKNTIINRKCPTCRESLEVSNITCLYELTNEEQNLTKNKIEATIDIFRNNPNGKFIIYSSFNNVYYQLFEEIDRLGLKSERLENNLFSFLKTIKNYKENKTNILFVSSVELIRGLSLETTSHLIFYHDLPVYELKKVLIHSAQRLGRSSPLNLIHLHSDIQL